MTYLNCKFRLLRRGDAGMVSRLPSKRFLVAAFTLMISACLSACPSGGYGPPPPYYGSPGITEYYPAPGLGLPGKPDSGEAFTDVVYIPYVEEILLPERIYAYQQFQVTLKVSAEYRPAVLRGATSRGAVGGAAGPYFAYNPSTPFPEGIHTFTPIAYENGVYLDTTILRPMGLGSEANEFSYTIQGLQPGQVLFRYFTTTSREFGGIGWFFSSSKGPAPGDPVEWLTQYVVKKELVITVLPAEDGETGG
jgi:hypothetical protein